MPNQTFDRHLLRIKKLKDRPNKIIIENEFVPLNKTFPPYEDLKLEIFEETVQRIVTARKNNKPVMLAFGAHAIKNGVVSILQNLIHKGWVTLLATNGAGVIHDWEFAFQGQSSEDVKTNVADGQFGIWEETGFYINLALVVGAYQGLGYGESIGSLIYHQGLNIPCVDDLYQFVSTNLKEKPTSCASALDLVHKINEFEMAQGFLPVPHPFRQFSVQAKAFELSVPFTAHPMIGHDIIYNHPMNSGAAIGRSAEKDFLTFAQQVCQLEGGVYLSVGSAVMSPMVFEKSLSMAQNMKLQEGSHIDNHYILVADLAEANWNWKKGEPPVTDPAYYLRYCKTFHRMGGTMNYLTTDNVRFLALLNQKLSTCKI